MSTPANAPTSAPPVVLGLDPGIRATGIGLVTGGQLMHAELVTNPCKKGSTLREVHAMARAVVERVTPRLYGQGSVHVVCERPLKPWRSTFLSLQPLMAIGAAVQGMLTDSINHEGPWEYFPAAWKGTGDGDACTQRVRRRLSVTEFGRVVLPKKTCDACRLHSGGACLRPAWCLAHNVYDGIGIGLKAVGRFEYTPKVRR